MSTKNNKTLVTMKFGSHLYGTDTEKSDTDYKGIFFPSSEQIFLGRIPKSINTSTKNHELGKNTNEDIDTEVYSLHYFLKLACEGQTVALDMLHAPNSMILETSDIWKDLVSKRDKFYTKKLQAFIGYARAQCSRYGMKAERLNSAKYFLTLLEQMRDEDKLESIWGAIKEDDHIHFLGKNANGVEQIQVCGKIFQDRFLVGYVKDIMRVFMSKYGHRAEEAAENYNIDWKACSHCLRTLYEVKEVLTDNTITFPLKEAEYVKKVKAGQLNYLDEVSPKIEELLVEVELLSDKSKLPEKVDQKYWDDWLYNTVLNEFGLVYKDQW